MKKTILFTALCGLLCINNVKAQLKFKNHENNPILVAVAYFVKTDEFEGWYSSGWYSVEPGETATIIAGDLKFNTYYYYAKDTKGAEWKGGGKYKFIVDNKAFEIKNADKEYQLKGERSTKAFKKVDVGVAKTYTLTLTEEED